MNELTWDYKVAAQTLTKRVVPENPGVVATMLKSIVASEGVNIYRDVPRLAGMMLDRGIRESAVKQVELVLYGSSLVRYLDQLSSGLSAIDINNIILTAESAGLSSRVARKTVSDILYSLNVPQLAQDLTAVEMGQQSSDSVLYIPPTAYTSRMNELEQKVRSGQSLTDDDFSELNFFASAGVPAASTLLGRIYLEGLGVPANEQTALERLQFAAAHGDAGAYGMLGDYYYGRDNQKAYALYCRPGAMALDEKRWTRFRNLEKVKRFNRTQLLMMLVLTAVVTLFMLLLNDSVVTGGHMTAAIVLTVVNCLVTAAAAVVHLRNPYQELQNLSLPLLATFFLYAMILI